jgi:hypothetical protein
VNPLPAILISAMLVLPTASPRAEAVLSRRIFVEFLTSPSSQELTAAERWGAKWYSKAEAAGRPVAIRVARNDSTTLISLESVAICERAKGCPLLVFRDIGKSPVLESFSFQNLILDYRDKGTFLIIRVWETVSECSLPTSGKGRCKHIPKK